MKQFFTQIVTGRDNFTVDALKLLAILAVLVGLVLECAAVFLKLPGQPFDLQAYGIGLGALLLSAGGALKLKADTEPSDSVSIRTETQVTETK